jgi:YesN/AraC family two-component response regulator
VALPDSAATDECRPGLYERIHYDAGLEARAFERLAECDLRGCRAALGKLVDNLDGAAARRAPSQVVPLLVDVLQQVNRRIHPGPLQDTAYQAQRVDLIEQFSACDTFEAACERFLPALNRLLEPLQHERGSRHPLVHRAMQYIEQNHRRRVSLSSVAAMLNVSPNYLSRLFRREAGLTLTAFVHRVRLDHAIGLLTESNRSISEIAYRVGYQNYRDFYRNFVKYEKASPREVRRRLGPSA